MKTYTQESNLFRIHLHNKLDKERIKYALNQAEITYKTHHNDPPILSVISKDHDRTHSILRRFGYTIQKF